MNEHIYEAINIALPFICGYIVWLLKRERKIRNANIKGIMLLLRGELKGIHDECMCKKEISALELSNFQEIYNAYTSLKGNGVAERYKAEVDNLPIKIVVEE